ncbi:MAG: hypothetical protein KIH80_001810 [Flavobacteriia bacterium]|nr:hypothetical protein [Flavobacteriia bacterium]
MKRLQKKMSDSFSSPGSFGGFDNQATQAEEKNAKVSKKKDPVGEYIDFEEIE